MTDVKGGYQRPVTGTYISDSWQGHKNRKPPSLEPGTDYGIAYGSAVFAPEDGIVASVDHNPGGAEGRRLTIDLSDGRRVSFIHLSRITVNSGQKVKRGMEVAKSGASAHGKEWGVGAHLHVSLWDGHRYVPGPRGSMDGTTDFVPQIGADNDAAAVAYSQTVANEQAYLNAAQGEKLVIDGLRGPATIAAYKRYQTYLKTRGWYSGDIDGIWGPATQAGHEKRYAEWVRQTQAPPSPQYHTVTLDDIASIGDVRGLQKIANLYLRQTIDNRWGQNSKRGLQLFLDQNYGGSLVAWLRAKWGYVGNDQFGPVMKAALQRANAANLRAL